MVRTGERERMMKWSPGPGNQRSAGVELSQARFARLEAIILEQVDVGGDFRRAGVKLQLHAVLQGDPIVGQKLQSTDEPLLGSKKAGERDDVATANLLGIPMPHVDGRTLPGLHDLAGSPVDLDLANPC